MEKVSVLFSGPAFSFLLCENARSKYDQEGFLLGNYIESTTKTVTDDPNDVVNISRMIKISSVIPCPHQHYIYDAAGEVDLEKIQSLIGTQEGEVVAWYIFKKNSDNFKLMLRQKIVHKKLMHLLARNNTDLFTCCLLTANSIVSGATHTYSQTFIRYFENKFEQVPLHIPNLGDSNQTFKSSESMSKVLNKILNSVEIDGKIEDVEAINKIYSAVQDHIDTRVENISNAERKLFYLEQEVKSLQMNLKTNRDLNCDGFFTTNVVIENGTGDNLCTQTNAKGNPPMKLIKTGRGRGRGRKLVSQNSVNNVEIDKLGQDKQADGEQVNTKSSPSNTLKSQEFPNMSYANVTRDKH